MQCPDVRALVYRCAPHCVHGDPVSAGRRFQPAAVWCAVLVHAVVPSSCRASGWALLQTSLRSRRFPGHATDSIDTASRRSPRRGGEDACKLSVVAAAVINFSDENPHELRPVILSQRFPLRKKQQVSELLTDHRLFTISCDEGQSSSRTQDSRTASRGTSRCLHVLEMSAAEV